MGTVTVSLPSDGVILDAAKYNTPITTIVDTMNGNIDSNNLASSAVSTAKLADGGVTSAKVAAGIPVQIVATNYSAVGTTTTTIPYDDTIPQNTEGAEFMTQAIIPKSGTNRLFIEAKIVGSHTAVVEHIAALFQDNTASALAVGIEYGSSATGEATLHITHDMVAGTTSATTFKVRAGGSGAGTYTFNGRGGARKFGGATLSTIKITEYKV